jgi:predicted permease
MLNLTGQGDPVLVIGQRVSGNYFTALGVNPVIGRGFGPEEDSPSGAAAVAVLSYAFWTRQFGADPNILTRSISLNGRPYNIVGVAPRSFLGLNELYGADVWIPVATSSYLNSSDVLINRRRALMFSAVGRLKPGVSMAHAESSLQALAAQLEQQYPDDNEGRRIRLTPVGEAALAERTRPVVTNASALLLIISLLVLLIACANVANLLLARAAGRRKEITIRLALGAGRGRLIRQLLTESVLLAVLGGVAGLALAKWSLIGVWAMRPPMFNYSGIQLALDRTVLAYTLAMALVTGLIFGLVPALRATSTDLASDLKQRTGRTAAGRWQIGSLLVSGQIAFSAVALVGAGLFIQSMRNATRIDTGFDVERLGIVSFNTGEQGYSEARGRDYQKRVREIAAATPGVVSASVGSDTPLHIAGSRTVIVEGQDNAVGSRGRFTITSVVWPGYFQTMGIPIRRGRDFTTAEANGPRAAIVNEAAAARFWPGEDPLGRRLSFAGDPTPVVVVGIVRNANYQSIGELPQALIYLSLVQYYFPRAVLYIRTNGDPDAIAGAVRKQIQPVDRNLMLRSESVSKTIRESLWAQRLSAILLAVFGAIALMLSTMGIYGVIAYSVNQRMQEFGVRMALGATGVRVLRMVMGEGMRLAIAGVAVGGLIGLGVARAIQGMLLASSPYDAATFLLVPLVLILVALVACWLPATRAMRTDPLVALRDE